MNSGAMDHIYQEVAKATGVRNFSDELIHYTSFDNLVSALQTNQLWFSSVCDLNDTSEYDHFLDALAQSGTRYYSDQYISPLSGQAFSRSFVKRNTFVSSWCEYFSAKPNGALSMWRIYGTNRGVGIVIDSSTFQPLDVGAKSITFPVHTSKVDYVSQQDIHAYADDIMDRYGQLYLPLPEQVKPVLFQALMYAKAPCVKHPEFYEEKEIRFIHTPHLLAQNDTRVGVIEAEDIQGSPRNFYKLNLQPYEQYDLDFRLARLLKKILVGPSQLQDQTALEVRKLLNQFGMSHVDVVKTEIPIRLTA